MSFFPQEVGILITGKGGISTGPFIGMTMLLTNVGSILRLSPNISTMALKRMKMVKKATLRRIL